MKHTSGLGLVEVLIAIVILAVGVLAASGLQTSALKGTRTAKISQTLSNLAQSELQLQQGFVRSVDDPTKGETCRSTSSAEGFSCSSVNIYPCELSSGALTCKDGSVSNPVAWQITVVVAGPDHKHFKASTVMYSPPPPEAQP
jgi:Tfp pilus assembly protein PilV